jgi:hypothetical protein
MATKTRSELADKISDLCDQAGCGDSIRKLHKSQFVDKRWNPHPSPTFVNWWNSMGAKATENRSGRTWIGIDATRAFNCEAARETYSEAKQMGVI